PCGSRAKILFTSISIHRTPSTSGPVEAQIKQEIIFLTSLNSIIMKKLFYSLGITSFLVCMIFTVATSVTNPFYGMSDAAVAQATTQTTTSGSNGSTTGNYGGNVSYSINPNIYKVMSGRAKYTVSRKE